MSAAALPPPRGQSRPPILRAIVVALLCMAPVPGDIGSCGQPVQALDPVVFFGSKKELDCEHCESCGVDDKTCTTACNPNAPFTESFPDGCVPLVHDGEVCLRALIYASCDDYRSYLADDRPTTPTECDFCPGTRP